MLAVRRSHSGWAVDCEGSDAEATRLPDAIREAVRADRDPTPLLAARRDRRALEEWIAETAAHIVGDTLQ